MGAGPCTGAAPAREDHMADRRPPRDVPHRGTDSEAPLSRDRATDGPADAAAAARARPSELQLLRQQVQAISAFSTARRVREQAVAEMAAGRSREMRMDATRSLAVLRRQQQALIARAHEQLAVTGELLHETAERRVVLAHRHEWFVDTVARRLEDGGVRVVARLDNGADAVGVTVAEQPDLVLVGDTLAMLSGEQVVRDVRRFAPDALVAAQVPGADQVGALLDAGTSAVFTRQVSPFDVALGLLDLLRGASAGVPARA